MDPSYFYSSVYILAISEICLAMSVGLVYCTVGYVLTTGGGLFGSGGSDGCEGNSGSSGTDCGGSGGSEWFVY